MRLMVIGDDPAFNAQLRGSVANRWPQSEVIEYNPLHSGPLAAEIQAQGFDAVLLDHSSIDDVKHLASRDRFAPVIFLAEHGADASCEAALKSGACAALGRNDAPSAAGLAAISSAAALQANAREQYHRSGQFAQEQRFGGARVPGYRRVRTIAAGHFAELHLAESDARGELVAVKVARDTTTDPELDHAFRRLLQEHDLAQRVDPQFVVKVYDLGLSDEHA